MTNPDPGMTANKIIIQNLHKSYEAGGRFFEALRGVNLEVGHGEFTGLVGPSGSGKTTLLNLIGGLDNPTAGKVLVEGVDLSTMTQNQLADFRNLNMGFIFQSYNLLPVYTAFENIEFPLILTGGTRKSARRQTVMEMMDRVGLSGKENKRPSELSGGECQRVAIARAMVKNPSLVLADEPTANLDAENSHAILSIMENLNRDMKTTFIFSTHDQKVMDHLRRVVRLTDGSITSDEPGKANSPVSTNVTTHVTTHVNTPENEISQSTGGQQ